VRKKKEDKKKKAQKKNTLPGPGIEPTDS
jgi:hypothetical protein